MYEKPQENKDVRLDATITKIRQLKYAYNLGHGEVRIKCATSDTYALSHGLLRIGVLTKDTLDHNKLSHAVEEKDMTRSDAELELLMLAKKQTYHLSRVIRGINNALQKLPSNVIKDASSLSESELYSTYFDPILSSIISDPERNTLLQWSNKKPQESQNMRPDATLTKVRQLKYAYNLGHGEVKIKCATCDTYALAHELLRICVLTKDTLDQNKLSHVLGFQVHGFTITFYLMTLQLTGIYTLLEISKSHYTKISPDVKNPV